MMAFFPEEQQAACACSIDILAAEFPVWRAKISSFSLGEIDLIVDVLGVLFVRWVIHMGTRLLPRIALRRLTTLSHHPVVVSRGGSIWLSRGDVSFSFFISKPLPLPCLFFYQMRRQNPPTLFPPCAPGMRGRGLDPSSTT